MREVDRAKILPSFAPKKFVLDDSLEESAVDFLKVFRLFQGKHYRYQHERQGAILEKLSVHYSSGIFASHIPNLLELVDLVRGQLQLISAQEWGQILHPFCKLLSRFELPIVDNVHEKDADQIQTVKQIIFKLSQLFTVNDVKLSNCVVSVLLKFSRQSIACGNGKLPVFQIKRFSPEGFIDTQDNFTAMPHNPPDCSPIELEEAKPKETRQDCGSVGLLYFEGLDILQMVLASVQATEQCDNLHIQLLKSTLALVNTLIVDEFHASSFLRNGGLQLYAGKLDPSTLNSSADGCFDELDQLLVQSILWRFLHTPGPVKNLAVESITNGPTFSILVNGLRVLSTAPPGKLNREQKELRNELAAILLLVLQAVEIASLCKYANETDCFSEARKGTTETRPIVGKIAENLLISLRVLASTFIASFQEPDLLECEATNLATATNTHAFSKKKSHVLPPIAGDHGGVDLNYRVPEKLAVDAEFRKLMLDILLMTLEDPQCFEVVLNSGFLRLVGCYMTSKVKAIESRYKRRHVKEIQMRLVSAVSCHFEQFLHEFTRAGGVDWALRFIKDVVADELGLVDLNDIHGKLLCLMPIAIRHLSLLVSHLPEMRVYIGQLGIFPLLVRILQCKATSSETIRLTMYLLSALSAGCQENQLAFGSTEGGPSTVTSFLHFKSCNIQEQHSIHMATVEALWGTISGCISNEKSFLASSGVFLLLDNLEQTPNHERGLCQHYLGLLLDLLENPLVRAHLLEWRCNADNRRNVAHLLLKMWREEDTLLQVAYEGNMFIKLGTTTPLVGASQSRVADPQFDRFAQVELESFAAQDVRYGIRSKIFALFNQLGFHTFEDTLSTDDKMKLLVISNYLDLKVGEAWLEVEHELTDAHIRPVTPDRRCLELAQEVTCEKIRAIRAQQQHLYQQQQQADQERADKFYKARQATAIVLSTQ